VQLFKHLTANDVHLEPFPFKRELSMEAYLIENECVLSLDNDTFSDVEIVDAELTLKQGRKSKNTDGRIDILATYSQEYIAVVELKIGQLDSIHLEQLEDYLQQKQQILEQYPDILDKELTPFPKWIGVLVGTNIDSELALKLRLGYTTQSGIQIAALTVQRFRGTDSSIYVTTDTYFNSSILKRDTSKYKFDGAIYVKRRLVLAVIKKYVESNPEISFAELEKAFPQSCQGPAGIFTTIEKANKIHTDTDHKRHFLNADELIKLSDSTIAISSQWGIGNINRFIQQAAKNGYVINVTNG
jgi:hypothetical protein